MVQHAQGGAHVPDDEGAGRPVHADGALVRGFLDQERDQSQPL